MEVVGHEVEEIGGGFEVDGVEELEGRYIGGPRLYKIQSQDQAMKGCN